jgi:LmbE family N-acetylglucosaminyl deacetylase
MFKNFFGLNQTPVILCLGAHPDDIEIGCGGTLLKIAKEIPGAQFYWVVFSGSEERTKEAIQSAYLFLGNDKLRLVATKSFRDSYFPFFGAQIKEYFEMLKSQITPNLIFTHYLMDAHQDHRLISKLTWNTFRKSLIFEYEIPKYEGDLKTPNVYICLDNCYVETKVANLLTVFKTQKDKNWFERDAFMSLMRLRGLETNSQKFAEGFHVRKLVL